VDDRTLAVLEFQHVLDLCAEEASSSLGRDFVRAMTPATSLAEVERLLAETTEARSLVDRGTHIPLGGIHDIRPSLERASAGGVLDPAALLDIASTIGAAHALRAFFQEQEGTPAMAAIASGLGSFGGVYGRITAAIGPGGEVLDDASPSLARIRQRLRNTRARVRDYMEAMVRSPNVARILQEPIVTMRDGRYVVPVRQDARQELPGIVHDVSASGLTVYVEPMACVDMNNEIRRLEAEEKDEVEHILAELSAAVAQAAPDLAVTVSALGRLDAVVARGRFSQRLQALAPAVNTAGRIRLFSVRHPLLRPPEGRAVVPIDIELGGSFQVLVITGPNTGGKTVTLKTLGLAVLMAQTGLHIPAERGSEVSVFGGVYADIGDEQSIEQNLSTFSGHMRNIVRIMADVPRVRSAGGHCLVLLDELSAGTDPTEGAALAQAILEAFRNQGALVAATTHYSELKAYAYVTPGVQNAAMEFSLETLAPTYRLFMGVPGRSNAIEIAARLGLPEAVVALARSLCTPQHAKTEDLLGQITADRSKAKVFMEQARRERDEAQALREQAAQILAHAREEEKKAKEAVQRQATAELNQARARIEALVAELRRLVKEWEKDRRAVAPRQADEIIRQARAEVSQAEEKLLDLALAGPPPDPAALHVNDLVALTDSAATGVVLGEPDADGNVPVQVGAMRVMVHYTRLRLAEKPAAKPLPTRSTASGAERAVTISPALDLRGQRVDDALALLDKYLDDAALAGLGRVLIIHGKGTGALRQAVHEFLREHAHVSSLRLGDRSEGGDGVTVVELRG